MRVFFHKGLFKIFKTKIREKYSRLKSTKNILAKISSEKKKDKGITAFIAFSEALGNSSFRKNWFFYMAPHNHIWKKIHERIFVRKFAKEYWKGNPRKIIRKKIREKIDKGTFIALMKPQVTVSSERTPLNCFFLYGPA